jgi:hypothetical protein
MIAVKESSTLERMLAAFQSIGLSRAEAELAAAANSMNPANRDLADPLNNLGADMSRAMMNTGPAKRSDIEWL